MWVAVVLNEHGFDLERRFVFPFVVDQGDKADALDPEPKLSAGLWLVLCSDVQGNGGNVNMCLKGYKNAKWDMKVIIGRCGAFVVE